MNEIQKHYGPLVHDWVSGVIKKIPQQPLVLIGRHGSGKTRLWRALSFFVKTLQVDFIQTWNYPLEGIEVAVSEEEAMPPEWIWNRWILINKQMVEPHWMENRISWLSCHYVKNHITIKGPLSIVHLEDRVPKSEDIIKDLLEC